MYNKTINDDKEKKINSIEFVFILFICAYYLMPIISNALKWYIALIIGIIYILYLIFYVKIEKNIIKVIIKYILLILFFSFIYMILYDTWAISQEVDNRNIKIFFSKNYQLFFSFFPLLLYCRLRKLSDNWKKIICFILFFMILSVIINTFNELKFDNRITRSFEKIDELNEKNVASYTFVYCISVLLPVCLAIAIYKRSLFGYISVFIQIIFLFRALYTLAIIGALLGAYVVCIKFLFIKRKYIVAIIGGIVILLLLPFLLMLYIKINQESDITIRFAEIANIISDFEFGYNSTGRLTLYMKCIGAFIKSPIWGNSQLDFDGHGTLLMIPAQLGLLGAIPYYYLFYKSPLYLKYLMNNDKAYDLALCPFISLIFMGYTNPITNVKNVFLVVYMITPILLEIFKCENYKINNTENYKEA